MKFNSFLNKLLSVLILVCVSNNFVMAAPDASMVRRPKVALVLSGGGAKGISHVGVIRYLREIGIPIDYVVGTSMGSIIGCMYSLGYTDEQMIEIISSLDWPYYMGDGVERNELSYRAKMDYDHYEVNLPFGTTEFFNGELNQLKKGKGLAKDVITSIIPSGIISGNNILNLFYNLCVGYTEPMDFSDLPVPFACVSTNIIDGTAIVHRSGILPLAIRSSMAIPGVFAPVYNDTQVLMDGGIRDNFPTDVARQMGADIIIGVNLAIEKEKDPEELRSLAAQFSQLTKIFTSNNLEENKSLCDVLIYPNMKGHNSLDFSEENIEEVMQMGYAEAKKHEKELRSIHDFLSEYGRTEQRYQAPRVKPLIGETFRVTHISMPGIKDGDKDWLLKISGLKQGEYMTLKTLDDATSVFYGIKAYSVVLYVIEKDPMEDGYMVEFRMTPEKPHSMDMSVRLDTHDAVQSVLRLGFNERILYGLQGEFTAKMSYNPSFNMTLSMLPKELPRLSFSYDVSKREADLYTDGILTDNVKYIDQKFQLFASEYMLRNFHFKVGTQYKRMNFLRAMSSLWETSIDSKMRPIRTFGIVAEGYYDNLDDFYFADKGSTASLRIYQNLWHFREKGTELRPFTCVNLSYKHFVPITDRLSLIPQVYTTLNFDKQCHWSDESYPANYGEDLALCFYPVYAQKLGGAVADYDFYGQVPFAGMYQSSSVPNALVGRLDTRYYLLNNQYITLKLNYARVADLDYLFTSSVEDGNGGVYHISGLDYLGAAIEYSVNTRLGPLSIETGWNNVMERLGVFISIGRLF